MPNWISKPSFVVPRWPASPALLMRTSIVRPFQGVGGAAHAREIAEVELDELPVLPELVEDGLGLVARPPGDDDVRAAAAKLDGGDAADAAVRPGDEVRLALEIGHEDGGLDST